MPWSRWAPTSPCCAQWANCARSAPNADSNSRLLHAGAQEQALAVQVVFGPAAVHRCVRAEETGGILAVVELPRGPADAGLLEEVHPLLRRFQADQAINT